MSRNGTGGGSRTRTPLRAWRFERHAYSQFRHPGPVRDHRIVQPPDPWPPAGSRWAVTQWREITFGLDAFTEKAWHVSGVINPAEHANRLRFGVPESPARTALLSPLADRSGDSKYRADPRTHPIQERETCRVERNVEAIVDIALFLCDMILILIDEHSTIAVKTSSEEVRKVFIGDLQRAECQALGRRETDRDEPGIETAISPLDVVAPAIGVLGDGVREAKTASC